MSFNETSELSFFIYEKVVPFQHREVVRVEELLIHGAQRSPWHILNAQ